MKHLVMKDIRLIGITNLIIIAIAAVGGGFGIYLDEGFKSNYAYAFIMIVGLFTVNATLAAKETKLKSDALIISLPLRKFDIVRARYLTILIYIFALLGTIYLTSNAGKVLFKDMPGNALGFIEILIISSVIIVFFSLYIPFQYHNHKNAQILGAILYMLAILTPNVLERFDINIDDLSAIKKLLAMEYGGLGFILMGLGLILYTTSIFVSKEIYEAKEF